MQGFPRDGVGPPFAIPFVIGPQPLHKPKPAGCGSFQRFQRGHDVDRADLPFEVPSSAVPFGEGGARKFRAYGTPHLPNLGRFLDRINRDFGGISEIQ